MEPAQQAIAALDIHVQGAVAELADAGSAQVDEDDAFHELPRVEASALVEGLHAGESLSISEIAESSMLGMASIAAVESLEADGQGLEARVGERSMESAPTPQQGQVQAMVEAAPSEMVGVAAHGPSGVANAIAEIPAQLVSPGAQVEIQAAEPALDMPVAHDRAVVEQPRVQGFMESVQLDASLVALGKESGQSDAGEATEDGEGDSDSQAGSASAALPPPVESPVSKARPESAEAFPPRSALGAKPKLASLGSLAPGQAALAEKFGLGKDGKAPAVADPAPWQAQSLGESLSKGAKASALPFRGDRPVSKLKRNKEE